MGHPYPRLFEPFTFKELQLKNRFVMAPMTRSFSQGGVPTADVAAYYRRRAQNSVGMIITEGAVIDDIASAGDPNIPRFFGSKSLAAWSTVADLVHAAGGVIVPQLWHIGGMLPINNGIHTITPVSPSGLAADGVRIGEPASADRIEAIVRAFATAGQSAQEADFDGVELHGAHGYLIDQFLWAATNRRDDVYGGSSDKRTRFAVEIIRELRRHVRPSFPIVFRFSQWKVQDFAARPFASPHELEKFLHPLADAGVDIFHCSTRRFWEPAFPGSALTLAGWTKKIIARPTIAVGSVGLDNEFLSSLLQGAGATATPLDAAERWLRMGKQTLLRSAVRFSPIPPGSRKSAAMIQRRGQPFQPMRSKP